MATFCAGGKAEPDADKAEYGRKHADAPSHAVVDHQARRHIDDGENDIY